MDKKRFFQNDLKKRALPRNVGIYGADMDKNDFFYMISKNELYRVMLMFMEKIWTKTLSSTWSQKRSFTVKCWYLWRRYGQNAIFSTWIQKPSFTAKCWYLRRRYVQKRFLLHDLQKRRFRRYVDIFAYIPKKRLFQSDLKITQVFSKFRYMQIYC